MERVFNTPFFHEAALRLPVPAQPVLDALAERGILGGLTLGEFFDGMDDVVLVCATETKTDDDLAAYADALSDVLAEMAEVA